ncbi:Catalase-peroxidase [Anoxybacillus sp. BCO1]|nr:Catalase-peroxidase [Anoxybacillus sp. BCO1]
MENKCPFHGSVTNHTSNKTTNKDWWPNQLNLSILHQHDRKTNPHDETFDYAEQFQTLDYWALKEDLRKLMTTSRIGGLPTTDITVHYLSAWLGILQEHIALATDEAALPQVRNGSPR